MCLVPSHTGIRGYEKADSAAKYQLIYSFHLAKWLEWCGCEQASFCQVCPGRSAVILQAVQEGWNCLVSCPHRSYSSDAFIHLEEGSSTSVWALSVYSDSSPHFGRVQLFCWKKSDIFGKSFRFQPALSFIINFNLSICNKLILHSSLHCL